MHTSRDQFYTWYDIFRNLPVKYFVITGTENAHKHYVFSQIPFSSDKSFPSFGVFLWGQMSYNIQSILSQVYFNFPLVRYHCWTNESLIIQYTQHMRVHAWHMRVHVCTCHELSKGIKRKTHLRSPWVHVRLTEYTMHSIKYVHRFIRLFWYFVFS